MQRLEVSGAARPIYGSLGVKRLRVHLLVYELHRYQNARYNDKIFQRIV